MPSREQEDSGEETEESEETESEESEEDEETDEETDEEEDDVAAKQAEAKRAAERAILEEEERAKAMMKQEMMASGGGGGGGDDEFVQQLQNEPHDAEFEVKGAEEIATPPPSTKKTAPSDAPIAEIKNDTHDAAIELGADEAHQVVTPRRESAGMQEEALKDQSHDMAFDVGADGAVPHVQTPPSQPMGVPQQEDGKALKNDTHDVAFPVEDGDSVSSDEEQQAKHEAVKQAQQAAAAVAQAQAVPQSVVQPSEQTQQIAPSPSALPPVQEDSSSDDDEAGGASPNKTDGEKGLYDPAEYEYLQVGKEVKDLFQFITVYKAHEVEVEPKLHPFIPDYIPAIGDIDGFIKVSPPDGNPSNLGLTVLDEPGSNQSNASLVEWKLRQDMKIPLSDKDENVERVDDAHQKTKLIDKFLAGVQKLHQGTHRPQVTYSKPMPDLETLLQVWPAEFEDLLSRDLTLPPATIDLDVIQYVRVVCALLDIPCYTNLVESVHVLLSLYSEFKANPHFQGGAFSNIPL
eukprot:TRINITY_DN1363_c0_g1_i4.p1 TRINITY_DN1363_c0_g1~~TRINITY_DN1363_c0_g1_i4.p1  ORF type:complete len:518 (+),score=269.60 TRINITY_DN1363_c0_g1_i4:142-1695(+)